MNEQELVKGLIDSGIIAILVAYIFRLDNQRVANDVRHEAREQAISDARAEDNNRWLMVFARNTNPQVMPFNSKTPTTLE